MRILRCSYLIGFEAHSSIHINCCSGAYRRETPLNSDEMPSVGMISLRMMVCKENYDMFASKTKDS